MDFLLGLTLRERHVIPILVGVVIALRPHRPAAREQRAQLEVVVIVAGGAADMLREGRVEAAAWPFEAVGAMACACHFCHARQTAQHGSERERGVDGRGKGKKKERETEKKNPLERLG